MVLDRDDWITGLFVGLALSKYPLALPLVLFLVYRRKALPLAVAALVQDLGLLALALAAHMTPLQAIKGILRCSSGPCGPSSASILPCSSPRLGVHMCGAGVGAAFPGFHLVTRAIPNRRGEQTNTICPLAFHVLATFSIWSLLAVYHAFYDTVLIFFFYIVVVWVVGHTDHWLLTAKQRLGVAWVTVAAGVVLSLPSFIYDLRPALALVPSWPES